MVTESPLDLLEAQLRENYAKIVYSHKTQEKCADILSKRNNSIKTIQIILSALTTTGLMVKVFQGANWALVVGTIFSTIQLALTAFMKEYNLGETIQKHSNTASEMWEVREQYLSLLTDLKAGLVTPEEVLHKRDELLEKLSKTYKGSPRTFSKAYKAAQDALKINEELTFNDDEIDNFLPSQLRKS